MNRVIVLAIYSTLLFGPAVSLAKDKSSATKEKPTATKEKTADVAKDKPAASTSPKPAALPSANPTPQVVEISVTKSGFVPAEVKVKAGQPVKLLVTRKIEQTCAKDIVIKDFNINQPLPLNQTVEVLFTPTKPGAARFACAMDMIAGVIIAE
jgi:plastocyanin